MVLPEEALDTCGRSTVGCTVDRRATSEVKGRRRESYPTPLD